MRLAKREQAWDDRGAVAVEFALLLPMLLLLLFGIIEFGFLFNTQLALTHAAREGARVEALDSGDPVGATQDAVTAPGIAGTDVVVLVDACPDPPDPGDQARVRATLDYSPILLPFGPVSMQGEAVMRCGG